MKTNLIIIQNLKYSMMVQQRHSYMEIIIRSKFYKIIFIRSQLPLNKYSSYHMDQMMIYTPKKNQQILKIKIIDVIGSQHLVNISSCFTGYQLKQFIFDHLTKELKTRQMRLTYEGAELENNTKISQFNVAVGNMLVFRQEKINLSQISKIIVHNVEDEVFGESQQFQWPCGHYIGQAGIVAHIKAVISKGECQIRCPFQLQNGSKCNFQWDYNTCKKIGVFTAQQKKEFQLQLSENYMKQHQRFCPKCNQKISKQVQSNRVRCPYPNCKYGDFCYRCLGPWTNKSSNILCGSQTCIFANQFLVQAPWDRLFSVNDEKLKKCIQVKTPRYRACPTCYSVIQNFTACKHTQCTNCKKKFCWICLATYNNSWPCGSYSKYCGSVAQVQNFQGKH